MACTTLTNISKSCDNNMGGIRQAWLWDAESNIPASSSFNTGSYSWTSYSVGGPSNIISYEFIRNASNYTEEPTIDLVNGSSFVATNLSLVFTRREAGKSKSIKIMGEGQRYLGALVLDSNGIYWLFEDLQLSAVPGGSGTAKADGSKYTVTLTGETLNLAGTVATAKAALLVASGSFV